MHPRTLLGGLKAKIRSGSVCMQTKSEAVHRNPGIKDISLIWLVSVSGSGKERKTEEDAAYEGAIVAVSCRLKVNVGRRQTDFNKRMLNVFNQFSFSFILRDQTN